MLFAQAWLYRDAIEGWAAIACGVLYGLMLSRLWDVAASYRRSLVRERTLRVASASLASARSVQDVAAAVRAAAATLAPAAPERRSRCSPSGTATTCSASSRAARWTRPSEPIGIWHRLACQPMPRFVSRAEFLAVRDDIENGRRSGAGDGTEHDTGGAPPLALPAPGGLRRRATRARMVFPLNLKDRPDGDPFIGLLAFFGDQQGLTDASAALEILAGQATLAVERVVLTREVVRQRGETLFRTLVHDTSDVILILGDDRRIRFATPSAADFFGDVTVEGKRLTDLLGPDGRGDVDRVIDLMLTLSGGDDTAAGAADAEDGEGTPDAESDAEDGGATGRR